MTNELHTLNTLAEPIKQSILGLLVLHAGGLVSSSAFTAAADVILEKTMGKKHPMWLLIVYSIIVGIIYRGYTTNWISNINTVDSVAVALVGAGYGILSVGIYFAILKPLKAVLLGFVESKFKSKR